MRSNVQITIWIITFLAASALSYPWPSQMSCSYGPRGSLTAICVNATAIYFKLTNYRFDYMDETLQCLNCSLRSLEQGTFDIPGNEIKTLDIRNSSVTKIWPKAFIGMIYMERLLLSNNPIEVVYPEAFLGVRKIKYIGMENTVNHLEPFVFKELHVLEILILSKNKLQELKPGTFEGLHNLKILDLSYNELKHVKDCFNPLVNLKVLKLSHNSIRKVYGNEFNALKTLLLLNLEYNQMFNFTTNISGDNTLRTLNLGHNSLNALSFKPSTFGNLNALEELDLSDNEFFNITVRLFQGLYRLRILNLSKNNITTINTGSFVGLPHLRVLNISSNKIHDLKVTGRFSLPSLAILDLGKNEIVEFDYMSLIFRTPRLRYIILEDNKLSCKSISQLQVLFEDDSIRFLVTEDAGDCPKLNKEQAAELIQKNTEQMEYRLVNNNLLIWMFVLMTLVILLIGVLFYVQFFIVLRLGSRPRIRILSNLGLRRTNQQDV
ncbi:unnamed protein product [Psylliodes chrysocephalus]|uniref:Insulin-like growth factor-binding protein complex acid labile subunit n=1 Tax=Psylliodes chrysocephalus TaxID=3402493 RepID=A0A9P0CKG2_9CUCU|nr:unnamed protein product [Psylliodes chrysocephala]